MNVFVKLNEPRYLFKLCHGEKTKNKISSLFLGGN